MKPWFYLIKLGWVAGGVSSRTRTGIWLLRLVTVVLSGLASVSSNESVLPSFPGPLLGVGAIASSVSGAVLFAWALPLSGIRGKKARRKVTAWAGRPRPTPQL